MANTNLDLNGGSLDLGGNTGTIGGGIDTGGGSIDIGGGIEIQPTGVTPPALEEVDAWYPQPDDGSRDEACYLDIKKKFSEYNPSMSISISAECPTYSEMINGTAAISLQYP